MSQHPEKSGNHSHSSPQSTPAQERIEETLRTLQETLRRLQQEGSIPDRSRSNNRSREPSSRGYRTVAPAPSTPSTSRGSSSSNSSKRPSDGEQSYHRRQAKRRLTEINGKLAEAEDRLGRLTRELNARRDLERRAHEAREEVARLKGIRKEYGEHGVKEQIRGTSRTTYTGPQQQPKLHRTGRVSPVRAPRRNINQVYPRDTHRGAHCSGNKTGHTEAKNKGIDWTSVHETNRWRTDFQSDSDGDIEDRHLFSSTDGPSSSMRRSASPGPPPYRTTKNVRDVVPERHEDATNRKGTATSTSSNIRSASGSDIPDLRLQIGKNKVARTSDTPAQKPNPRPQPLPRSKSSRGPAIKSSSTESQESFEVIEVRDDSDRSTPPTPDQFDWLLAN